MRRFKLSILALQIITLTMTILPGPVRSQSGRGRPKVAPPGAATPSPELANVPAAAAVVKQEQVGNTWRFVLRNGMTVIISEQHAAPIVAAVAYFKAGALDEPVAATGITRLLQHLVLRRMPSGAGLIGGDTSYDSSGYYFTASPDRVKDALTIQANALQNPLFNSDEVRREIPLAIEEERTFGEPAAYSLARLYNIAFGERAIGRWRPKGAEALRSVTQEQLTEFYRAHYRPDTLVVSVSGDVQTFTTLVQIQQLYGAFGAAQASRPAAGGKPAASPAAGAANPGAPKPGKPPRGPQSGKPAPPAAAQQESGAELNNQDLTHAVNPPAEDEQPKLRYGADRGDINQSVVSIGYRVPGLESKDWAAIETLAALIGRGRASRLNRSLVDGEMVTGRVESNYMPLTGSGMLTVQMWPAADPRGGSSIDKAESAFFREMDAVRREIPAEGDMARARAQLEKHFFDETGNYLGRARALARAEASPAGFRLALDYINQIRAVRAEDVQRAAAKYFTLANTSVHEYEPQGAAARTFDAERFAAAVTSWSPTFAHPVDGGRARPAEAGSSIGPVAQGFERTAEQQLSFESIQPLAVRDFSTLNGPRAYVREEHAVPTVAVALLFQGGRVAEDESTSGTTELMLRSILYGTARRFGANIALELDQLGARVEVVAEPDFFGFMLSVLSRNADRALKLLRDAIEEPAFRDADVQRARLAQLVFIREDRDSTLARSRELLLQALFPGHAYSLPPHGREEAVLKLTSEQVQQWHSQAVKRQLPLAIIVGDTNGSALVSGQLAEGFKRRELDKSLDVKVAQPKSGEKAESRRLGQTTAAVGFAGPKTESDDVIAIEVVEAVMNGDGGRLLTELRDKQGLALAANLEHQSMFTAGAIYARLVTLPGDEQRARAAFLAELERIARAPLSADEIEQGRSTAIASKLALMQSQSAHALEYARAIFYKREPSMADNFADRLSKVTADDVKRVAAAYFKPPAASAGVVRGVAPAEPQPPPK
ncbi:MAG: M16 family metallopeptidase [Blastocatellia bacterium]